MSQTEPMPVPGEMPKSHDLGDPKTRSRWPGALTLSLLAAAVCIAALAYSLRYGMELTPDGWAYWQSSVSLLEGRGYRYFVGPTIIEWPPLYPLYLAAWECFLGVSGRTLVIANVALAGFAAFNWTAIFLGPLWQLKRPGYVHDPVLAAPSDEAISCVDAPEGRGSASGSLAFASLLVVVFVSSTIVSFYRSVLAQNLVYAVLPVLFYGASRSTRAAGRVFLAFAGLNGLLATVLLLAHNSAVAFLLPVAVVLARCRSNTLRTRAAALLLSSVLPLVPWLALRAWLGQLHSHPVGLGVSNFSLTEYLDQMLGDTADLLLTIRFGLGFVALLFVIGFIWHQLKQEKRSSVIGSAIRTYLLMAVFASLCLLAIFMATWINDPLGTRFILFLPLTLFCSAACRVTARGRVPPGCGRVPNPAHRDDRRSPRLLPTWLFLDSRPAAILACLAAVAAIRLVFWTTNVDPFWRDFQIAGWHPGDLFPHGFAYKQFTIAPDLIRGEPRREGDQLVVPPPCYRWIELRLRERMAKRPIREGRTLEDLIFGPNLTEAEVVAIWGPRDFTRGSGIQYDAYRLDGRHEVWFWFDPGSGRLLLASLVPITPENPILASLRKHLSTLLRKQLNIDPTERERILYRHAIRMSG